MKPATIPILALVLALMLSCSGCSQLIPARSTLPSVEPGPSSEAAAETAASTAAATAPTEDELPMLESYQSILENLCYDHTWPDGTDTGFDGSFYSIEENQFAISDVDGDGQKELVVSFTTTSMAGMALVIYGWENGSPQAELTEFPSSTIYEGGYVKADASHNHSMSMEFWPYTLYRYNTATNRYEEIARVSGWEKEFGEKDYDGQPFPDSKAENGMVYRLEQNGAVLILSPTEFAEWEKQNMPTTELSLVWQTLDQQSIHAVSTGEAQDWRRGLSAPENMLWSGQNMDVFVCAEEGRIALYPNAAQKHLLAQAEFPKPLDLTNLAEYTCTLADLDENGTGDPDIHFTFRDGSEATLLWLWDDASGTYVYNTEFSFYPGEPSGKG